MTEQYLCAMNRVVHTHTGMRCQHYKGKCYEVLYVATHTETMKKFVVNKEVYACNEDYDGTVWCRPFRMFHSKVRYRGKLINRFKFLENVE